MKKFTMPRVGIMLMLADVEFIRPYTKNCILVETSDKKYLVQHAYFTKATLNLVPLASQEAEDTKWFVLSRELNASVTMI